MNRGCALVAAGLLLAGCTSGPPSATADRSPSSASSPAPSTSPASSGPGTPSAGTSPSRTSAPAPSPSASVRTYRQLHFTATARIPLTGQTHGQGLVTWEDRAAWVGCNGCGRTPPEPRTLYVADLRTRRVRAVTTVAAGQFVAPLGGSGAVLAYLVVAPARNGSARWTVLARDVTAPQAAARTLAATTQTAEGPPPMAVVGQGRLVWQAPRPDAAGGFRGPVVAVDLRTGAVTRLLRDLAGMVRAVTPAGLLYLRGEPPERPFDGPTDAVLAAPGLEPRVLSVTRDVRDLVAGEAVAVWQTAESPDAGVWSVPLDRAAPARLHHRGGSGDVAVGRGFLAVLTTGDYAVLLLYPLAGGSVVAIGDVPLEFEPVAAAGSRLAYLAMPGERGVRLDAEHPIQLVAGTVDLPTGR